VSVYELFERPLYSISQLSKFRQQWQRNNSNITCSSNAVRTSRKSDR